MNYTDNTYSWFEKESYTTETDTDLKLKLNGDSPSVDNATLLIDDVEQKELITDKDGIVTVNINKPGTYHLSATRSNDAVEINLVRLYAKVEITQKATPSEPEVDKSN